MIDNKYQQIGQDAIKGGLEVRNKKSEWKLLKKGTHLQISNTEYKEGSLKINKIEGVIPANIQKVVNYYHNNIDGQKAARSEMMVEMKKVEVVSEDTLVFFSKTKSKLLVSSRETLAVQHKAKLSENEYVVVKGHLASHPQVAFSKDSVQAELKVFALFFTKIDEGKTQLQGFTLSDPKGSIPSSITNSMADMQLKAFENDIESLLKL